MLETQKVFRHLNQAIVSVFNMYLQSQGSR